MNIKHFILLSLANLKSNKRFAVISTAIISLCMLLCIVVNCISESFNACAAEQPDKKMCRTITVGSNLDILDEIKALEHVSYAQEDFRNISVGIESCTLDFAENGAYIDNYSLLLTSFYDNLIPEVVAGETIKDGMKNVGLIPNHFQPSVYYNSSSYIKPNMPLLKGENFIGETITYSYGVLKDYGKPPSEDNWKVFTSSFKVIGVYDVLKYNADPLLVFLPLADMKETYDNSATDDAKIMGAKEYAIVIDKSENVSAVIEMLSKKRQSIMEEEAAKYADHPELHTTESIRYIDRPWYKFDPTYNIARGAVLAKAVQTISIALLVFLLISIYLLVLSSLNKRKSQIALLKVQGYSFSQITACLILEGVFICL
ncbi:MAG: hypothetical protein LBS74_01905, partial [Oscillospiraceae bacterium]|nr:hypothetical protein [Oscillospiraceae bacterium]